MSNPKERVLRVYPDLSRLTWHGVRVNQDKGDKTKDKYRHTEEEHIEDYRVIPVIDAVDTCQGPLSCLDKMTE